MLASPAAANRLGMALSEPGRSREAIRHKPDYDEALTTCGDPLLAARQG